MSVSCSHCSALNADTGVYCVSCGYPLATSTSPQPAVVPPPYLAAQGAAAPPSRPFYSGAPAPSQQPMYSTGAPYAVQTAQQPPSPAQVGGNQGGASFRRAFAGHGAMVMHQSWLLDGSGAHATSVRNSIVDLMRRRGILGTSVTPAKLTERGVLMEVRDYVEIRRGVSTVFTYVAPAGQDLYISRATTVLPAISRFRAIVMILLAVLFLAGLASSSSTPVVVGFSEVAAPSPLKLFATGLILPFFVLFFIASAISWVVEKDFWVYLRPRSLNDFQLDDIALLEHATDGVVVDAVKQEGLDASKITPPPFGYQPKRRIRAV
ncbi:MAG TPA: hypothetical protein VKQ30_20320 [Ktedonobacterales bacterium]|nr:hypothetical protein [Ktedonobacterales bacterium]